MCCAHAKVAVTKSMIRVLGETLSVSLVTGRAVGDRPHHSPPGRQEYVTVTNYIRTHWPSGGSSSTTISTLLIAARRSAGRELSASSIASSNGSLRPGSGRASISAMVPESVLG